MKKIPTSQDCYYKWSPKKSGETSINLSAEISNYIAPEISAGEESNVVFVLHKEDFIKAAGYIINVLPLYTSTSQSSNKVVFSPALYEKLVSKINTFFGVFEESSYIVNLKYREDGRIYLNNLEYKGFNIREFLVEYFSEIVFNIVGNTIDLRIHVGPIGTNCKYLSSEERRDAFFDFIELRKKGKTISNYKEAASNPKRGTTIYLNMEKMGMLGMLYDYTDVSIIHQLYQHVVADPDNAVWNQICSATVACYRDFLLWFEEKPIVQNNLIEPQHPIVVKNLPLQQIFYGAPGTGKSHGIDTQTLGESVIRTTFHPDSDYSTFVGAYKPTTKEVELRDVSGHKIIEGGKPVTEDRIVYEFVEQAFLQAYVKAWKFYAENPENPKKQYLIIEEINRGNCAQIFGDLFQLLDRNDDGFSSYDIKPDTDIMKYIQKQNLGVKEVGDSSGMRDISEEINSGALLSLPPNLYIWATMNTSDQSLFPIDSAFKRRWDWKYVPIDTRKESWKIVADGRSFDWGSFLERINREIGETTSSEDKKLGFYFCKAKKGVISADKFVSKVLFYVYNDVFKDYGFDKEFFKDGGDTMSFQSFYNMDGSVNEAQVLKMLTNLQVNEVSKVGVNEDGENDPEATVKEGKHDFISSIIINGKKFDKEHYTHFEMYMEALREIGIDRVAPIIENCRYKRKSCPLASTVKHDAIEQSGSFSYVEEGGYYFVKGAADETLINVLNLLKGELSLDLTIETYR